MDKSKISSLEMLTLLDVLERTKKRITQIRGECKHDFEVLSTISDFEGYYNDLVITDIDYVHCKICGKTQYIER